MKRALFSLIFSFVFFHLHASNNANALFVEDFSVSGGWTEIESEDYDIHYAVYLNELCFWVQDNYYSSEREDRLQAIHPFEQNPADPRNLQAKVHLELSKAERNSPSSEVSLILADHFDLNQAGTITLTMNTDGQLALKLKLNGSDSEIIKSEPSFVSLSIPGSPDEFWLELQSTQTGYEGRVWPIDQRRPEKAGLFLASDQFVRANTVALEHYKGAGYKYTGLCAHHLEIWSRHQNIITGHDISLAYDQPFTQDDELFAFSVADLGDVNGDTIPDFVVGSPFSKQQSDAVGSVRVISGADQTLLFEVFGSVAGMQLGFDVANAGDVDNDGINDVIAGAPESDTQAGYALVLSGADGQFLYQLAGSVVGDRFGHAVCGVGDADKDGRPDFAVAAPMNNEVWVYSGRDGLPLHHLIGPIGSDQFGSCLAAGGDIDHDNRPELLVGDPFGDEGVLHIISLRDGAFLNQLTGQASSDHFAFSACGLGDLDYDGHADFAVAAPLEDSQGMIECGVVRIYSGQNLELMYEFSGPNDQARLGMSLASAGDVDSDGWQDVMAGAPWDSEFYNQAGRVQIMSGQSGDLLCDILPQSTDLNNFLGSTISAVGDLNQDGFDDVLLGLPFDDRGANNGGGLQIWLGQPQTADNIPPKIEIESSASQSILRYHDPDGWEDLVLDGLKYFENGQNKTHWLEQCLANDPDTCALTVIDNHSFEIVINKDLRGIQIETSVYDSAWQCAEADNQADAGLGDRKSR